MTELTPSQQMRLDILRLVMNDTAAAQKAIEFVKDNLLKFELFKIQIQLVQTEQGIVARTDKAIRNAEEALSLFN
ncbi:DUF2560 family protein [Xenorhabdus szentirmaii]|uniref:DUF2560 family protein n=1 Tax=Xenorhabdus szentirmaii TaxID=290112 RepID=A0AAW3YXS6_9GAMM|nr:MULTISPECIES: DUF2560 family protein [unclassified Xenorhabdus]MBD2791563.1 DUF2560 family protein [Xenorhabdus sp. CUL]MBD2802331.1 DUF2560 family protein [Xenorhabdus sp. M]MBD2825602.1 DUF2560 family protein [Xenorhabdus sp. 5]